MPSSSIDLPLPRGDADLIPLSWLSQWHYCPRRCGLLALEQLWTDNAYTAEGSRQHQRVHTARTEKRGDNVGLYELPVFSEALGLSGLCDCVEAHRVPEGAAALPGLDGMWQLYPVEYKHGVVRKDETEYHLQLCAQAMCLEEMYGGYIPKGAIFFIQDHRRDEVLLTESLQANVREAAKALRQMMAEGKIPPAVKSAKCRKCSMIDDCMPDIRRTAARYLADLMKDLSEDDS